MNEGDLVGIAVACVMAVGFVIFLWDQFFPR